jgi:hypothetical protein
MCECTHVNGLKIEYEDEQVFANIPTHQQLRQYDFFTLYLHNMFPPWTPSYPGALLQQYLICINGVIC